MKTPVTSSVDMMPPDLTVPVMFGPNITGRFNRDASGGRAWGVITQENNSTGPFYAGANVGRGMAGSESVQAGDLMFDASLANSTYSGSTVQPVSIRLLPCIKL